MTPAKLQNLRSWQIVSRDYVTPDDKYLFGVEIIDSCSVFSGATQG